MELVESNASGAAAAKDYGTPLQLSQPASPPPPTSDWRRLSAHLLALGQRVGMSADVPSAATRHYMRVVVCLEDAATGRVATLPPALRHPLRPGLSDRACIELLLPATERGLATLRGLRHTWSGRRAADVAPLWECLCVEVRGRGTLEAAAGVLAAWARAFPDAVTRVGEVRDDERAIEDDGRKDAAPRTRSARRNPQAGADADDRLHLARRS